MARKVQERKVRAARGAVVSFIAFLVNGIGANFMMIPWW
jgi:hypothetical protein